MYLEDLHIIKPSAAGPYTTIQSAIQAALTSNPPSAVVITPEYAGTDTYTNASNVSILDLRPTASNSGALGGVLKGVQAKAAAQITAAAQSAAFVTTLNLPGGSIMEGVPFTVKASGYATLGAGTYTATVQPLIYASTSAGFTASAAAAIVSAAAVSVTVASASVVQVPWTVKADLSADSTSGRLVGTYLGYVWNGAAQLIDLAVIANPVTSIALSGATPLQFLCGVTTTGASLPATSVLNLGSFLLEA